MPSPFPGMNPYLEQAAIWQDFHTKFLPAISAQLVPQVVPKYIVMLEEHIYLHEPSSDEPRRLIGRADLSVSHASDVPFAGGLAVAVAEEAPAEVLMVDMDVEREPFRYLEIRDRRSRELVTVVELLSPINKRPGPDRERYLARRRELIQSPAHLVEIDLLRGGDLAAPEVHPDSDYSVLVSPYAERPRAGFWPIGLRDRLPNVPIPLRAPDAPARLDLRAALDRVYDESGYEHFLYDRPPEPPLTPDEAAWARPFLPQPA